MPSGIFIKPVDIRILHGIGYQQAWRRLNFVKDALGKPKNKAITIQEYAQYEMISVDEIKSKLKIK